MPHEEDCASSIIDFLIVEYRSWRGLLGRSDLIIGTSSSTGRARIRPAAT